MISPKPKPTARRKVGLGKPQRKIKVTVEPKIPKRKNSNKPPVPMPRVQRAPAPKRVPKSPRSPKRNLPLVPGSPRSIMPIPSGPRVPRERKEIPSGPKRKSPGITNPKPRAKKPTLDDFLSKGKRPPVKIKPGLKRPSDYDVIIKGYNDKKYKG